MYDNYDYKNLNPTRITISKTSPNINHFITLSNPQLYSSPQGTHIAIILDSIGLSRIGGDLEGHWETQRLSGSNPLGLMRSEGQAPL